MSACRYCAGEGGRYRLVYSRFLGCEPQVHQGEWERCWKCDGTGNETGTTKLPEGAEVGVDSQSPTSPQGDTSRRKEDATP